MTIKEIMKITEAVLFASEDPLSTKEIFRIIDEVDVSEKQIKEAIDLLNSDYSDQNRAFTLSERGKGWQFVTTESVQHWIQKLFSKKQNSRLTQRAVETLSIIAYKQPITKSEIEEIRGVNSDGIVRSLLEKELITVTGRQKSPGSPMLYGTTRRFLLHFGLNDITDLPNLKEIEELLSTDENLEKEIVAIDPEKLGMKSDNESEEKNPSELADNLDSDTNSNNSNSDEDNLESAKNSNNEDEPLN